MSNIHKPQIVYSGNWAFRLVDPSAVLNKGEIAFKHTSYPKTFLDKFSIPPFNHMRAKKVHGDGETALEDMHYSYGSPNAVFYQPDFALTEQYRRELWQTKENDYTAGDGNDYFPAPLDCEPDLAVGLNSKREVISGANRYGSRLVRNDAERQLGGITGWAYYLRRDRVPAWDGTLLETAPPLADPEKDEDKQAELEVLYKRIADLEEQVEQILVTMSR